MINGDRVPSGQLGPNKHEECTNMEITAMTSRAVLEAARDRLRKMTAAHSDPAGAECTELMRAYHQMCKVVEYPADLV
jgi:hypothetical protein